MLAELYQQEGRVEEAIGVVQQLAAEAPEDLALRLSLCDLLYESGDDEEVIQVSSGTENNSNSELACLHLKAKALARKGLETAATETYAACLRKSSGRDSELLKEIRYERAEHLEKTGQARKARADWERLYAQDPAFRDVAVRVNQGDQDA